MRCAASRAAIVFARSACSPFTLTLLRTPKTAARISIATEIPTNVLGIAAEIMDFGGNMERCPRNMDCRIVMAAN